MKHHTCSVCSGIVKAKQIGYGSILSHSSVRKRYWILEFEAIYLMFVSLRDISMLSRQHKSAHVERYCHSRASLLSYANISTRIRPFNCIIHGYRISSVSAKDQPSNTMLQVNVIAHNGRLSSGLDDGHLAAANAPCVFNEKDSVCCA